MLFLIEKFVKELFSQIIFKSVFCVVLEPNTSMTFYGNHGGDDFEGAGSGAGGGGAGGTGNTGYYTGGNGGAGKTWTASGDTDTKYAGGGGGGGLNRSSTDYYQPGSHGGGNFHGGGGGGVGSIGANWVTASGFSGCIKFKLPSTT